MNKIEKSMLGYTATVMLAILLAHIFSNLRMDGIETKLDQLIESQVVELDDVVSMYLSWERDEADDQPDTPTHSHTSKCIWCTADDGDTSGNIYMAGQDSAGLHFKTFRKE